jgi:hypothetical protein
MKYTERTLGHCARCGRAFVVGDFVVDVDVVAAATGAAIVYELGGNRAHLQCPT